MSPFVDLIGPAIDVLQDNDAGIFTSPSKELPPFQWNWDSCLTAMGQRHYDEGRAWTEIESLFAAQWPDGMVPHLIYQQPPPDSYFPRPEDWQTGRDTPTSGFSHPPAAGFAVARLWKTRRDTESVRPRLEALIPRITAWHRWFHQYRDPENTGLVSIIHPWESGRTSAVEFDGPVARLPGDDIQSRNTALLKMFRDVNWHAGEVYAIAPFRVTDPVVNAILIRSCSDLAIVADAFDLTDLASENRDYAKRGIEALESLWSATRRQYLARDDVSGQLIDVPSIGGLLPVFAPIAQSRVHCIAETISRLAISVHHLVPSLDPAEPGFDPTRHWRGPIWPIVNYLIADGLLRAGAEATAARIVESSLSLIEKNGFAKFYDPMDGTPNGDGHFSLTAAMVLEFVNLHDDEPDKSTPAT